MRDITPKMILAVPCPTCGVYAGMRCLLYSGDPRNEPHVDRKLIAIGAIESNGIRRPGRGESR
jgi:hypothetical protein